MYVSSCTVIRIWRALWLRAPDHAVSICDITWKNIERSHYKSWWLLARQWTPQQRHYITTTEHHRVYACVNAHWNHSRDFRRFTTQRSTHHHSPLRFTQFFGSYVVRGWRHAYYSARWGAISADISCSDERFQNKQTRSCLIALMIIERKQYVTSCISDKDHCRLRWDLCRKRIHCPRQSKYFVQAVRSIDKRREKNIGDNVSGFSSSKTTLVSKDEAPAASNYLQKIQLIAASLTASDVNAGKPETLSTWTWQQTRCSAALPVHCCQMILI